ncbi:MAG: STAS domain-containing protein [Thermoguttaceae bacterium]|nr:STAS domain-containing protein [Thermoguttaceae bacterium]MDW8079931.1 STAS domain-containing protein [Thermoguttaceae bacterium]
MMATPLSAETFGPVTVVHAPEELSGDQVESFRQAVLALPQRCIVLDLDRTELLDSAGLTAIADLGDQIRLQSGQLKIATSDPINRKILEITRLDQELEVLPSVLEAVRSFRQELG